MIKQIVMWKLKEGTDASELRKRLEAMNGRIHGLLRVEVGIDLLHSEQSADLVLVAELADLESLEIYQNHPVHQAVVPFVKARAVSRVVVDYET